MGNSGSSGNNSGSHQQQQQQQCPLDNNEKEQMGRGWWTHSFPRELGRHGSQPPGHKVLPEPPNQRLRATNNGSIIHNGGTISGRRPSALTLPHDLNKGVYRSRSTSATKMGAAGGRSRSNEQIRQQCCRSSEVRCREHEMSELKRFGSEPDLRYSPMKDHGGSRNYQNEHQRRSHGNVAENRHNYYPERESRYRGGKKKYRAPAPPGNGEESSPDSYKWEFGQERPEDERTTTVEPPPRKSRLFKTRAESKRAQVGWQSCVAEEPPSESPLLLDRRERGWRKEKSDRESRWRNGIENNRSSFRSELRLGPCCESKYDGKNSLQRSLSSPEFQAELMQVARKVRNKLNYPASRRIGPVGAATIISSSDCRKIHSEANWSSDNVDRGKDRKGFRSRGEERQEEMEEDEEDARRSNRDKGKSRGYEGGGSLEVLSRRDDLRASARFNDIRGYEENERNSGRTREKRNEERESEKPRRRRVVEKSKYTYVEEEERITTTSELVTGRKSLNEESPEGIREDERRFFSGRQSRQFETPPRNSEEIAEGRRNDRKELERIGDQPRTRSESPALRNCRDRSDLAMARGQGSGRESTPEPPRANQIKFEHRKRRIHTKDDHLVLNEKRSSNGYSRANLDKRDYKIHEKKHPKQASNESANWNGLPPSGKVAGKTYYSSVDDESPRDIGTNGETRQQVDREQARQQCRNSNDRAKNQTEDRKINGGSEDIALKLRPTLPKKQLEIPRFSPSAAWRLLSALETPEATMSTASEEVIMFEERIEGLPRSPLVGGGGPAHRSSHDKSGDSGISGDAGAANEDSVEVRTSGKKKRPSWTPQQDLGEESSSDAGLDSPAPPVPMPPIGPSSMKYSTRAHVFSLSLPRDDAARLSHTDRKILKESPSFNSLQKLKRSVSGALGLGPNEIEDRKRSGDNLGENWLLSTSAPNSLQHSRVNNNPDGLENSSPGWENDYSPEDNEIVDLDEEGADKPDFPMLMKAPSFSYLASGGHVMYLPDSNKNEQRTHQSLVYMNSSNRGGTSFGRECRKNSEETGSPKELANGGAMRERERSLADLASNSPRYPYLLKSCENISEMRQRSVSPVNNGPESLQDEKRNPARPAKTSGKNQKTKRFTFQSTVRQIERRRLAEKLSREAEAKERQRKSELEVMRKVEEEFQRKRAKEKANIRQQLRLYTMDENSSSLPPAWDTSQLSRADPDGAPSSSASSPTSPPPGKMDNRKSSVASDEIQHRKRLGESRGHHQPGQQQREYKEYRPKYYDWSPDASSHLDAKQTTVHPKVVYDIPKSSHVFVDANVHTAKPANVVSTPRSDNYRKDFAHGAVAGKSSLASSDSELSQPNTRPHSRQNGSKSKPLRSRSASPVRSEGAGSANGESPVQAVKQERNTGVNGFILNGVQPFVREKSYRPITFNPRPPPPIPT